ncbi:Xaa-Pro aminopeptidase [Psychrosphaera sp. 1_MG-2023]|uniref:Xaa-Pro aminopeptidase n=1 Tax=Psychrosphaera sp. 1_MG-2023 TaxID=3062643 RepID=UPI0026E37236|nr:Xaa-Pro aminopeptidase [Psychrosphaera sp. 1_MG-2023]MDO6720778.1 Xaa-Pro aminopeptidase [Psychrosphaera sp. 1_MG-2023]
MIPNSEFVTRRNRLLAQMAPNSVAIIPAANELTRSNDTEFPFRQNSDFQYLTNFPEPDAWLVLEKSLDTTSSTLVCRVKDKVAEIWQGRRIGAEVAKQQFEFDETFDESKLHSVLFTAINNTTILYWPQGESEANDKRIFDLLNELRTGPKKGWNAPTQISDPRPLIHEMRLFKSADEITVMKRAGVISSTAHKRAMLFAANLHKLKQPVTEFQLEAEIHHEFAMSGAKHPAYGTIVGGGENACILHYTENQDVIESGSLVLIDAGCELQGYAADITRTFPVSGKFSPEQKALYQLVLNTQVEVINNIKPGTTLKALTELSVRLITQGLVELNILEGDVTQLISHNAHRAFYMHGLAHWLGLDVHDVGDYNQAGAQRPLQAGMVFTVEPGIYIDSEANCEPKWHGIGIRIEDNILITETGYENLTITAPKSVEEIEALMQ